MIESITLFFFLLKAWAICLKLQHGYFLIIPIGAKAHFMDGFIKPDASLLRDTDQRTVGVVAPCRQRLRG